MNLTSFYCRSCNRVSWTRGSHGPVIYKHRHVLHCIRHNVILFAWYDQIYNQSTDRSWVYCLLSMFKSKIYKYAWLFESLQTLFLTKRIISYFREKKILKNVKYGIVANFTRVLKYEILPERRSSRKTSLTSGDVSYLTLHNIYYLRKYLS